MARGNLRGVRVLFFPTAVLVCAQCLLFVSEGAVLFFHNQAVLSFYIGTFFFFGLLWLMGDMGVLFYASIIAFLQLDLLYSVLPGLALALLYACRFWVYESILELHGALHALAAYVLSLALSAVLLCALSEGFVRIVGMLI